MRAAWGRCAAPAVGPIGMPADRRLLEKPIDDKIFARETLAFFASSPVPYSMLRLTVSAEAAN